MAAEINDLPYRAEYAKSGRAACKGCKNCIAKDSVRLAVLVQSHMFDGKVPHWYHYMCFFAKQRPKSASDFDNIESLKWEDQEKIKKKIAEYSNGAGPSPATEKKNGMSKKSSKNTAAKAACRDFIVEYAKSSRAMCRGCEIKIAKEELRISKKDFESEDAKRYGGKDLWHHVECFTKLRQELEFFEPASSLPGYKDLSKKDKATLDAALPKIDPVKKSDVVDGGEPSMKKIKKENGSDVSSVKKEDANGVDKTKEKEMKSQSKLLFKYVDKLKELKKSELQLLFTHNGMEPLTGNHDMQNHLADCLAFGCLTKCETCGSGQLAYKTGIGYVCTGDLSGWTKCTRIYTEPKRIKFSIPDELADNYAFLANYKPVITNRIIMYQNTPSSSKQSDTTDSGPKIVRTAPLKNLSFITVGKLPVDKENLKRQIVKLGGIVVSKLSPEITAVISTEAAVESLNGKMEEVKEMGIHVVPASFVDEAQKGGNTAELIEKMSISPWGKDVQKRIDASIVKSGAQSSKSKSAFTKSVPSKVMLKVTDGHAVDPDSNLSHNCKVYKEGKEFYDAVLSRTNVQTGQNSYYKIQLLENDARTRYYVFRSWGRIGTTIGDTRTDTFTSVENAKKEFLHHFHDKTGNQYSERDNFVKQPGLYYPVEVAYADDTISLVTESEIPSNLPEPVQKLISLIFDTGLMKKVMMEFELDLEKMPLGKLSRKQISMALMVLSRLQNSDGDIKPTEVVDATNQFYTLIPHDFGMESPTLLDNAEIIKSKVEMLESLMEMETAYNLLKESKGEGDNEAHPLDLHYSRLNTEIDVVMADHEEYVVVDKYIKNTHAETHRNYELELVYLYKINRKGEDKRYKPFRKLHNRMLLWHGSRVTNFVGILSQGLRIAPPEAPVTGYMFGKGIYFADMVSKSANYCMTSKDNSTGLLLLCEVALGDMYEKTHAEFIEKLPAGKHSCKGIGSTKPDPAETLKLENDVEVPLGKPIKHVHNTKTSLLYNEYIVYDPAQVKAKYLVKVNFKYKY